MRLIQLGSGDCKVALRSRSGRDVLCWPSWSMSYSHVPSLGQRTIAAGFRPLQGEKLRTTKASKRADGDISRQPPSPRVPSGSVFRRRRSVRLRSGAQHGVPHLWTRVSGPVDEVQVRNYVCCIGRTFKMMITHGVPFQHQVGNAFQQGLCCVSMLVRDGVFAAQGVACQLLTPAIETAVSGSAAQRARSQARSVGSRRSRRSFSEASVSGSSSSSRSKTPPPWGNGGLGDRMFSSSFGLATVGIVAVVLTESYSPQAEPCQTV